MNMEMLCEYLPQELFPLCGTIKGYCIVLNDERNTAK